MENNTVYKKHFSKMGLFLFFGSLLTFLIQMIVSIVIGLIPKISENYNFSFAANMISMYVIAFPLIYLMFKKVPVQFSGEKKKMKASHIFVAFLICYAGSYICNLLVTRVTGVLGKILDREIENVALNLTSSISMPMNFLFVAILAPIMEELVFRKMLIDRTAHFGEGISIVFSGLVFGLFHGNLLQFSYAFLLGVFFGFIYMKTRNIIYPIILHMGINFTSVLGVFVLEKSGYMEFMYDLQRISSDNTASGSDITALFYDHIGGLVAVLVYCGLLLLMVLAGVILFVVNRQKFALNPGHLFIEKGKRFNTVIVNVGMILYISFWLIMIILQLLGF